MKERAELRETLGLTDPIHIQFSRFVVNASKGEFGISYQLRRPVSELISERLPATIELVLISALIALVSGTLLGVYTGINRKGFLSDTILAISLLGVSLTHICYWYTLYLSFCGNLRNTYPLLVEERLLILVFGQQGFLTISGLKAIILTFGNS